MWEQEKSRHMHKSCEVYWNTVYAPEADLVDVVRLQQHLPQQTQKEGRRALHGEVCDDVVLDGHRLPLPVLLLHVLLQVKTALLWNVILLEERLGNEHKREVKLLWIWLKLHQKLHRQELYQRPQLQLFKDSWQF